jgi:hypothetical protein
MNIQGVQSSLFSPWSLADYNHFVSLSITVTLPRTMPFARTTAMDDGALMDDGKGSITDLPVRGLQTIRSFQTDRFWQNCISTNNRPAADPDPW